MNVLVLGGDGYLGWPTSLRFAARGHRVLAVDNYIKRAWERDAGVRPLLSVGLLAERAAAWARATGHDLQAVIGDLTDADFTHRLIADFGPDLIVHYGEQASAPYSMIDVAHAVQTQTNNVTGTLHVLYAMRDHAPDAHLIKLGTMGEYGTPNIDIEEGFIEIEHKGRRDTLPFPRQPGSMYHLSKVHDSHNLAFASRVWGLAATDLNQGVVYGWLTDETEADESLRTSFHYDAIFGTVLNRFCAQALVGHPLTVYGEGGQTRTFLNIRDTLQCVEVAAANPPAGGEYRVFNQFTEQFSVSQLAERVAACGAALGRDVVIEHLANPRVEAEQHYYNPVHTKLPNLGIIPRLLTDEFVRSLLDALAPHVGSIDQSLLVRPVEWRSAVPVSTAQETE